MTPGCVTTHRFASSISTIRSIAVKAIVSAPSRPAAPPLSPEPAPRGTIGTSMLGADPHELGDLGRLRGEGHGARQAGRQVGGLVAPVGLAVGGVGQERAGREGGPGRRRGTVR